MTTPYCRYNSATLDQSYTAKVTELYDYLPVALTVIMKCIERLVKDHITSTLPDTLDPLKFAYRTNRSTDDVIAITYSSAFNTIVPSMLIIKLKPLGLHPLPM